MNEVAERSGITVQYKVFDTWPQLNDALKGKQIQLIPNCGITPERETIADFTIPVETFHISLFIRSSTTDIHDVSDLSGRVVAVVKINNGLFIMKKQKGVTLQIHDSLEQALLSLLSGNADAFVYPEPPVPDYQKN
jgi:ABC-type amino acid transport substrate-binding protein